jgi:muramoyltetrapeptide carboxypeptidase
MMHRRDLVKWLALSSGAALAGAPSSLGVPSSLGAQSSLGPIAAPPVRHAAVRPRRLSPGDLVGLVLPASQAFEASTIELAREQLEAIGFRVRVGAHARARHGYLAGTDEQRAADLNAMFDDPEVRGVFAQRGGWGSPRLLPLLDFDAIRGNPKVFVGYSDITALLNAIHQQTGLVTFHGPVAATNIRPYTLDHLRRAIMRPEPLGTLENPPKEEGELVNRDYRILTLAAGRARGRLVGGNLSLIAALMGTPWELVTDGAILILEDIGEELYRVDRMLTQLQQTGKLDRVAGVVFGYCTDCPVKGPSLSLEELLHERFAGLGVPAMAGLAFGHVRQMVTLPIGLEGILDAGAGTLTFDQAAVV